MGTEMPKGMVRLFDDFLGGTLNSDLWTATVSTSGTAAITDVEIDGTVQLDTDTTSGDAGQLASSLNWRVQDGELRMEARVKADTVSNIRIIVGFSDATNESDTVPITNSADVFTAVATDFAGLSYDTAATTDVVTAAWIDDGAVATKAIADRQFTGCVPVADTYFTYIVELQDEGSGNPCTGTFTVIDNNGRMYSKTFYKEVIDRDVPLCAYVGFETATGSAMEVTIDYIEVTKSRASSID